MSNIFFIPFLLVSFLEKSSTLTVDVKNVQVGKGTIVVEIWNDEKTFLKKPLVAKSRKADNQSLEFSFELPEGEYAISVYQDINDNKKLDLGIFNIPKEPVGFGNNFRPKFSAPKYKDCAIILNRTMEIEIEIK
jgi:uncharacterized protein (DUF2141 family)